MMNKGLELIEALIFSVLMRSKLMLSFTRNLLSIAWSAISTALFLAQLGMPDMRTPIAYALSWPTRVKTPVKRLNLVEYYVDDL